MQFAWVTGGGCGIKVTVLILGLMCWTAGARNPESTIAGSAANVLGSDHREMELPSDERRNSSTWSQHNLDYNAETPVVWLKESGLPMTVELLIACCWIGMVASMPLIVLVLEGGSITRIQIINFMVMWFVLAGGFILFNKVLLFQSSHFTTQRSLTLVECVYLMSQILTTVGYGDITPADQTSQVFVAFYVMISLLIIANVASEAAAAIQTRTQKFAAEFKTHISKTITGSFGHLSPRFITETPADVEKSNSDRCRSMWSSTVELPPVPWSELLQSLFMYALFCVMGIMFYSNYPGENKTYLDCFYMCVITLSTVGFGAVTPVTEGGKVFGSFWMFFGTAALFKVVGDFMALIVMMKQREMWNAEEEMKKGIERIKELPNKLTAHDFIKLSLVQRGLMQRKDVVMLDKAFACLNPAADGTISKEDARRFLDFHD